MCRHLLAVIGPFLILVDITLGVRTVDFVSDVACWFGSVRKTSPSYVMGTTDGAIADGFEMPSNTKYITFKTDCKNNKILTCTATDNNRKDVTVDAVPIPEYKGKGCSSPFNMNDGEKEKTCVLGCAEKLRPILTCEGFVADEICVHQGKAGNGKINTGEQTASFVPEDLGLNIKPLPDKRITYTANCKTNVVKSCSIVDDFTGETILVGAEYNPQPGTKGCTSQDFKMKAVETTPAPKGKSQAKTSEIRMWCRMCCSKYGRAILTC